MWLLGYVQTEKAQSYDIRVVRSSEMKVSWNMNVITVKNYQSSWRIRQKLGSIFVNVFFLKTGLQLLQNNFIMWNVIK